VHHLLIFIHDLHIYAEIIRCSRSHNTRMRHACRHFLNRALLKILAEGHRVYFFEILRKVRQIQRCACFCWKKLLTPSFLHSKLSNFRCSVPKKNLLFFLSILRDFFFSASSTLFRSYWMYKHLKCTMFYFLPELWILKLAQRVFFRVLSKSTNRKLCIYQMYA
jgi:hypothetical protein